MALNHRMMLREVKFGLDIQMALETGFGISTGIDDEPRGAARPDVLAAGAMAGFTTALSDHRRILKMQARMRTGRKFTDDLSMTIGTGAVPNKMGAGNFQWNRHRCGGGGAGNQKKSQTRRKPQKNEYAECPFVFQRLRFCARTALVTEDPLMISETISLDKSPPVGNTI